MDNFQKWYVAQPPEPFSTSLRHIKLNYDGNSVCTGTILNSTLVLFALRCLMSKQLSRLQVQAEDFRPTNKHIRYDSESLSSNSNRQIRNISQIITPNDDCDNVTNDNDIITLVLSSPLDFEGKLYSSCKDYPDNPEDPVIASINRCQGFNSKANNNNILAEKLKYSKQKRSILLKKKQIMKMATELNVVTLNCWGIAGVSKDRVPRMKAIADELASGNYDFVFLQEVWTTEDYERIKLRTREVLPYSHYFFSGVIGAGICIFSKSPIKTAFFYQWALNGYIHKIQHGDWFGGKGIGLVEVEHRGLSIVLYTTHLHAEYDRVNDEYLAHRVIQAYQTAQLISLTSRHADVVIFGGDFNTEPGDLAYRVIVHTAQLRDSFFEVLKSNNSRDDVHTYTIDTPKNSYTSPSILKSNPYGKRIDYIVYKSGRNVDVKTISYEIPWPNRVKGQPFSYSDHEAVVVKLRVEKSSPVVEFKQNTKVVDGPAKEALIECIEICKQALKHLKYCKSFYAFSAMLIFVLFLTCSVFDFSGFMYFVLPVARILFLLVLCFTIFMCTVWNRMEVHGIMAGKLAMELELGLCPGSLEELKDTDSLTSSGQEVRNLEIDTIDSDVTLF